MFWFWFYKSKIIIKSSYESKKNHFLNDIANRLKSEQGNLETLIQRQIRNVMQDLGVPRQNEMDELRGRIDRLERQFRELENKQWR